jgi:hypothetical protein
MRWFYFQTDKGKKIAIQAMTRREAARIFLKEFAN